MYTVTPDDRLSLLAHRKTRRREGQMLSLLKQSIANEQASVLLAYMVIEYDM